MFDSAASKWIVLIERIKDGSVAYYRIHHKQMKITQLKALEKLEV